MGGVSADGAFSFSGGSATLRVNSPQTWLISSTGNSVAWPLSGGGPLTKTGSGSVVFSGTGNTHTGGFAINGGELRFNGSFPLEGAVTVNSGGTLSGTGTLGSTLITVASGGVYSPGAVGAGTLSSNALTLNNASNLNFSVGTSTTRGAVTGALTLDGVLNITAGPGFGQGTFTLFTATGAITNNSLTLGSVPSGFSYDYQVSGGSALLKVGPPATAVELGKLEAVSNGQGTLLSWEAGSEIRNLGYRVYREENGQRREVSGLIAGSALRASFDPIAGRSYSFVDAGERSGTRYWVEAIDLKGQSRWFGAVEAHGGTFSGVRSSALVAGLEPAARVTRQIADARLVDPPELDRGWRDPSPLRQWEVAASRGAVKLLVRQDGVYRVPADQLFAAGFPVGTPLASLQLWAGGRTIAFRPLSADGSTLQAGDALEFYGEAADTRYTATRVYWVTHGLGAPTLLGPAPPTDATGQASSFRESLEVRDRTLHISALINTDTDGFFGPPILGTRPTTRIFSTPAVDVLATDPALLEVSIQGLTAGAHTVDVQVNGTTVGTVEGDFQDVARGSFTLPPGSLVAGDNTVTLVGRTTSEIALELSQRLTYSRQFAFAGALRFTAPAGARLELTGPDAPGAHVLDVTSALSPGVVGTSASTTAAALIAPGTGTRILYAYRDEDVLTPVVMSDAPSAWHAPHEADLVVIGPRSLLPSLQPLADQRERDGLRVVAVDIEDVYDEFSAGQKDALAIRSFVSNALRAWSRPPRFVLLAGAATYDPRGWLGRPELDQVPTVQFATRYIETGSDDGLVTPDGSELPLLAVGRLPLSTPEQMEAAVAKILGRPLASPDGTVLLVHDRDENVDFSKASAEVGAALAGWRTQDLVRGVDDVATHAALLDDLRAGPVAVDYQGHGAEDFWNGRILSTADVDALTDSGHASLVVASTCLNGYFLDIGREALGPALLRIPRGGAWGVWASSALTFPTEHALLSKTLLAATLREGKTLGEATLEAKQAVTDPDVRASFQLLGDPSARAVASTSTPLTVAAPRGTAALGCSATGSERRSAVFLAVVGLWLLATRSRASAMRRR
jgi:autotransporter-associated beta strand protein